MAETLVNLRTRARRRADKENDPHIVDAELTAHINASYKELWDLLIAASADYFLTSTTFTLTGTTDTYALPSGLYKVRGVDWLNGAYQPVPHFNFRDRNRREARMYRVQGSSIQLIPLANAAGDYKLWYETAPTALSGDSDTISALVDMWDEYIVIDAGIKMLVKSESDTSALSAAKQEMVQRIATMVAARDTGEPETVTDVWSWADEPYLPRP